MRRLPYRSSSAGILNMRSGSSQSLPTQTGWQRITIFNFSLNKDGLTAIDSLELVMHGGPDLKIFGTQE